MTTDENLLNSEQSQGTPVSAGNDSVASDFAQAPVATQPREEYVPKSRVNEIIHAEKRRAYEKGMQEASQRVQPQQQQSTDNARQLLDESKVRELIKQEAQALEAKRYEDAQRLQQEQEAHRLYSELQSKFDAHRKNDPSLDEKLAEVDYFNGMPGVQFVLNQFDDAGALASYLRDNMANASHIEQLARYVDRSGRYNPKFAIEEMRRVSDRIKQNEAAKAAQFPTNPVSQVETTIRDGMGNSGLPDLQALKRDPRFRG